jgi:hypothetical protein
VKRLTSPIEEVREEENDKRREWKVGKKLEPWLRTGYSGDTSWKHPEGVKGNN